MSYDFNFNFKPKTIISPPPSLVNPPLLNNNQNSFQLPPVQQTTTSVVAPFFNHPVANQQLLSFQKAEVEAFQDVDFTAKKISACQQFIRDLHTTLDIDNSHYVTSFKQLVGLPFYKEICEFLAQKLTGSTDFLEGDRILKQNIKAILRFKDQNCHNPLEQIVIALSEKLELQRGIASLNSIGALLTQASKTHDLLQKNTLQVKAIEIFKKLPLFAKGVICEKIWRLDNSPIGNLNYGNDEALKDIQKLLVYKDVNLIQEAIDATRSRTQETQSLAVDFIHGDEISPIDSKSTIRDIVDLYIFEDLKKLISRPSTSNDVLFAKFNKLSPEMREQIYKLVWIASNKPSEYGFGERFIAQNVRVLVDVLKDENGSDMLTNLLDHHRELIKAQKLIAELKKFSMDCVNKQSTQILQLFNALSNNAKEGIRGRVWYEDGGKNDPNFGGWDYATKKIEQNPNCIFYGNNPFALYLNSLSERASRANAIMFEDLELKCTIPTQPVDVSTERLLRTPGLIDKLPPNLKTAFVTAELAGVASLGGLGPALDGMVRGLSPSSRVIMPMYLNGPISDLLLNSKREKPAYEVEHQGKKHKVFKVNVNGIRVYLIDAPELFTIPKKEDGTSGNFYNGTWPLVRKRWAVFQSLAEQVVYKMSKKEHPVELVHVHDSQTALIPELLAVRHSEEWKTGKTPAAVFTFHNNLDTQSYDQEETVAILEEIGLPKQKLNSFIKSIEVADAVTTVSETFGKEVQTKVFGNGVEEIVKTAAFRGNVYGIVNGNSNGWDATQDEQLQKWKAVSDGKEMDLRFGPNDPAFGDKIVTIQREICAYLKSKHPNDEAYADLDPEKPIVFYVGRYDSSQKGIDKLPLIMEEALKNGAQFVCVGVEPDDKSQEILSKMKKRALELGKKGVLILEDRKVGGKFLFQGVFGSLLRAACSVPIFPSIYEPCGLVDGELNRFGKKVVATKTGGFDNKIKTVGPDANGYLFKRCTNWYSQEQDDEIRKTLHVAVSDAKQMQAALYHGTEDQKRPFVDQMKKISYNTLNSTWEKTPDGSAHAIIRLEHVFAKAFDRRQKRGQIQTKLKTFKV